MKLRRFVGRPVLAIIAICIMATTLHANPYAKDLHKVCGTNHQKCLLGCAEDSIKAAEKTPSKSSFSCAEGCVDDFILCEKVIARYVELGEPYPIKYAQGVKYNTPEAAALLRRVNERMGNVPAEEKP